MQKWRDFITIMDKKKKNEEVFPCACCGWEVERAEDLTEYKGNLLCDSCYNDEMPVCAHCEQREERNSMVEVDGDFYCQSCQDTQLIECENCIDWATREDSYYIDQTGEWVCETCYNDGYFCCDSCGDTYRNERYDSDGCCVGCNEESDERSSVIKPYSADVLAYYKADQARRLFGVELEVATETDLDKIAEETSELVSGDAILKQDGSIDTGSYAGFEIVTRPMTLEHQFKFWNKFLDNCNENLRSYDVGTCGLHIHVTRASISRLTLGKLLVFVNAECNKPLIKRIAQRYNCGYSAKKEKKLTSTTNGDRYEFINLQKGYTIEFRLFRGTLNRTRLLACLEFTATLIEFCQQASIRDMTAPKFLEYVRRQPKLKNLKTIFRLKTDDSVENGIAEAGKDFSIPIQQFENELVRLRPRNPAAAFPF